MQQNLHASLNQQNNTKINGVLDGVIYGQNERTDEINDRILSRFFPDKQLQMNFDPRPVPTKYSLFPVIDRRIIAKEPIQTQPFINITDNFVPADKKPHCSGYFSNIEDEIELRNQTRRLQKGNKNAFIPSTTGELYKIIIPSGSQTKTNEHPFLDVQSKFISPTFDYKVGTDLFHNNTRTQIRNI